MSRAFFGQVPSSAFRIFVNGEVATRFEGACYLDARDEPPACRIRMVRSISTSVRRIDPMMSQQMPARCEKWH